MTNLEIDLYYVITNSYTKLLVNILNDDRDKSAKLVLAKGNNPVKKSSVTKLKLDKYYVITNLRTKF